MGSCCSAEVTIRLCECGGSTLQPPHPRNTHLPVAQSYMLATEQTSLVHICCHILRGCACYYPSLIFPISVLNRATAAGDKQVRVFDIGEVPSASSDVRETVYGTRQSCTHVLRCHEHRVKRIVTEHSPDSFLTVAEVRRL